ncbi:hypothetical protein RUND412_007274 [Rhizina undulata]
MASVTTHPQDRPNPGPLNMYYPHRAASGDYTTNLNPYAPPTPSPLSPYAASTSSNTAIFITVPGSVNMTIRRTSRGSIASPTRSNFSSPSASPTRFALRASRIQSLLACDPLLSRLTPRTITNLTNDESLNFSMAEKEWSIRAAEGIEKVGEWLKEVEGWNRNWARGRDGEGYLPPSLQKPKKRRKKVVAEEKGSRGDEGMELIEEVSVTGGVPDAPIRLSKKPLTPYQLKIQKQRAAAVGVEVPKTPIKEKPTRNLHGEPEVLGDVDDDEEGCEEETGDDENGDEGDVDDEDKDAEYWGSLKRETIEHYAARIEAIKSEIEELDVEGLKGKVLSYRTGLDYPLTDSSAVITATTLQLLPPLSRLTKLLSIWAVRIAVLKIVPVFLRWLDNAKNTLKAGYDALAHPSLTPSPREKTFAETESTDTEWRGLEEETYNLMLEMISQKVATAGKLMDTMLDALEGREDVLPDRWITELEEVEEGVGAWAMDAERVVLEGKLRRENILQSSRRAQVERQKRELVQEQERSIIEAALEEKRAAGVMENLEETDRQLREALEIHEVVADGIELPEDDGNGWEEYEEMERGMIFEMDGLMEKLRDVEDRDEDERRGRKARRDGSVDFNATFSESFSGSERGTVLNDDSDGDSEKTTIAEESIPQPVVIKNGKIPTPEPSPKILSRKEAKKIEEERTQELSAKQLKMEAAADAAERRRLAVIATRAAVALIEREAAEERERQRVAAEAEELKRRRLELETEAEAEAERQLFNEMENQFSVAAAEAKKKAAEERLAREEEVERERIAPFQVAEEADAEVERQRIAEAEAEVARLALIEKEAAEERQRQKLAKEEQERRRLAEEAESERLRLEEEERAERERTERENAERERAEAERQRIEAELQAAAAAEAEKKRIAEEEAEKLRLEREAAELERRRIAEEERIVAEAKALEELLERERIVKLEAERKRVEEVKRQEKLRLEAEAEAAARKMRLEMEAAEDEARAVEAVRRRVAEEEAEKIRLEKEAEVERKRIEAEIAAAVAAAEAEEKRLAEIAAAEAERRRVEAEIAAPAAKAEKKRLAEIAAAEAKRQRVEAEIAAAAAAEAEKKRLAEMAAAEAESRRVEAEIAAAAAEAEKKRLAEIAVAEAEETERRRLALAAAEAEAERVRLAKLEQEAFEEQERQRLEEEAIQRKAAEEAAIQLQEEENLGWEERDRRRRLAEDERVRLMDLKFAEEEKRWMAVEQERMDSMDRKIEEERIVLERKREDEERCRRDEEGLESRLSEPSDEPSSALTPVKESPSSLVSTENNSGDEQSILQSSTIPGSFPYPVSSSHSNHSVSIANAVSQDLLGENEADAKLPNPTFVIHPPTLTEELPGQSQYSLVPEDEPSSGSDKEESVDSPISSEVNPFECTEKSVKEGSEEICGSTEGIVTASGSLDPSNPVVSDQALVNACLDDNTKGDSLSGPVIASVESSPQGTDVDSENDLSNREYSSEDSILRHSSLQNVNSSAVPTNKETMPQTPRKKPFSDALAALKAPAQTVGGRFRSRNNGVEGSRMGRRRSSSEYLASKRSETRATPPPVNDYFSIPTNRKKKTVVVGDVSDDVSESIDSLLIRNDQGAVIDDECYFDEEEDYISELDVQPVTAVTRKPKTKRRLSVPPELESIIEVASPAKSIAHFEMDNSNTMDDTFEDKTDVSRSTSLNSLDVGSSIDSDEPSYDTIRPRPIAPRKRDGISLHKLFPSGPVPLNFRSDDKVKLRHHLRPPAEEHGKRKSTLDGDLDTEFRSIRSISSSSGYNSNESFVIAKAIPRGRKFSLSADEGDSSPVENDQFSRENSPDLPSSPDADIPVLRVAKRNGQQTLETPKSDSPTKRHRSNKKENTREKFKGSPLNFPDSSVLEGSPLYNFEDSLDQKINSILGTLPTKIRLTASNLRKLTETTNRKNRHSELSPTSIPGPRSVDFSPSPQTPLPSYARPSTRQHRPSVPGDIKLYHLHRSDGQPPIKLYVRLVGADGERVMVRVGGGWADLGEYLKEYAMHHASKKRVVSEGRVEIQDLAPPPVLHPKSSHNSLRRSPDPSSPVGGSRPGSPLAVANAKISPVSRRAESPMARRRPTSPALHSISTTAAVPVMRGGHNGTRARSAGNPTTPTSTSFMGRNELSPAVSTPRGSSPPSRPGSSSSSAAHYRRPATRLSYSYAESAVSDGASTTQSPEFSKPLGLAGPKGRKVNISPENQAWVDGMLGQVRKASEERRKNIHFNGSYVIGDGELSEAGEAVEGDYGGREFGGRLGDIGKAGSTWRVFPAKKG